MEDYSAGLKAKSKGLSVSMHGKTGHHLQDRMNGMEQNHPQASE